MIEHAYIHIPFCKNKCKYCSFVSGFNIEMKELYFDALFKEILKKYKNESLKTLYIGGGTPSLLESKDIYNLISKFNLKPDAEITLEANPESVEKIKFQNLHDIGVNRISLGCQTFNNDVLKYIGRLHNEKDVYDSIEIIKNTGFENISIDLIYGLPFQTADIFKMDVKKALSLNLKHISTYGLKIEEDSYFYTNPPLNIADDEMQAQMYLYLIHTLKENGYIHYEISNFAKEGYESCHNIAYWKNKNYYGFGLNASGFEGNLRYTNVSDMKDYLSNPLKHKEENHITQTENMENEIFLALRLKEGVNISEINKKYNIDFDEKYKNIKEKYKHLLNYNGKTLSLNEKGILVSNEIMAEFIS